MKKFQEKYTFQNGVTLRNRMVMAPMTTWSGNEDGTLSAEELDYYQMRSNEVAMVITATTYTLPHGQGFDGQFFAGTDEYLPSLKALANRIHKGGAKAILQVFHAGRKANPENMPDGFVRSASDIAPNRESTIIPKPMTEDEIQELIQSYYDITVRANKAGFDGIEIHGANTYLLQQFFSPHSNRRQDSWGGDLDNRIRLPLKIIEATLKAKKDLKKEEFIIGYRFSPEENYEIGITLDDTRFLVNKLVETDIDYLHISLQDYKATSIRSDEDNRMVLREVIQWIDGRKPFIGVGSVKNHLHANEILDLGADLVAVGRQLIAEPNMVARMEDYVIEHQKYKVNHHQQLNIPGPLHERILSAKGWFELEEE